MRRLSLNYKGLVTHQADAHAELRRPGDAVIVSRGRPRSLVISCPCGCQTQHPINLDDRSGPAWLLYPSEKRGISLYPSVWRTEGCKSHYIIWGGDILLFDNRRGVERMPAMELDADRRTRLLKTLTTKFRGLLEIANDVSEVPWDTLDALRSLESARLVEEGHGESEGTFRRTLV